MVSLNDVRYFSQWADPLYNRRIIEGEDPCFDPTWSASGFADADDYRFWARRLCGIACLKSILSAYRVHVPTTFQLLELALESGSYRKRGDGTVEGLLYEPFVQMIDSQFGLSGKIVVDTPASRIATVLPSDGFVIWSVSSEIRSPHLPNQRTGGHLILVMAADRDACIFHNPSGIEPYQSWVKLDYETLYRFSAGRGMAISRKPL
ncbi:MULTISPECIES: hypothetical protein [unclassified Caballeronia]|uniref:hypothetical protein n=1 Tax=unclassified Caballeronia TaxID=2646786 RepID=UPI0028564F6A|nr:MULTISPECIES: hypothetical protein [unclassified Caballeronia]MDR5775598.1 hypothetical protein [Caballeronia sp. LZ002]MDR5802307.1 hypothetical protein [Caballeronia sp. LZ001]MDR5851036.1 hypothetical protein [Caballeronia sp. LZ003]